MSVTVAARAGAGKGVRRLRASRGDLARLAVVLVLLASAVAAVRLAGLRLQQTGSLPRGLYRDVRGAPPTRGTLGVWCLTPDVARWAGTALAASRRSGRRCSRWRGTPYA